MVGFDQSQQSSKNGWGDLGNLAHEAIDGLKVAGQSAAELAAQSAAHALVDESQTVHLKVSGYDAGTNKTFSSTGVLADNQGHLLVDRSTALMAPELSVEYRGHNYQASLSAVSRAGALGVLDVPGLNADVPNNFASKGLGKLADGVLADSGSTHYTYSLASDGLAGDRFNRSDEDTRVAASAFHLGWVASTTFGLNRPLAGLASVVGVVDLFHDFKALANVHTSPEAFRYSVAMLGDVAMAAGGAAALFPETRVAGRLAIGAGQALGIGADFIPYRMVRDK